MVLPWVAARWGPAMEAALAEARLAAEVGDVPVGAVVVTPDGQIVGRGRNERELHGDPLAHAEVQALRGAARTRGGWRLDDCALVVTLEPCAMCAGAAAQSRVGQVVFGADDDKAGAVGSLWDVLRDPRLPHRPEVHRGLRAAESAELLRAFFVGRRARELPETGEVDGTSRSLEEAEGDPA